MKFKKLLFCLVFASIATPVLADSTVQPPIPVEETTSKIISVVIKERNRLPRFTYDETVYLTPSYKEIDTDNNWKRVDLKITNYSTNTDSIRVKVYDARGKNIDSVRIAVRSEETIRIPAESGTYTIAARAASKGNYRLYIYDVVVK